MRKLAIAAVSFSVAVFASHYLVSPDFYIFSASLCVVFSLTAVFLKDNFRRYVLLIAFAAALGFAVSYIGFDNKTLPARGVSGEEQMIQAQVTEYPEKYDTYSTVSLRITGGNVPKVNAVLYSFDNEFSELSPGDVIRANVKLKSSDERYGEPSSRFNAENVYLLCYLNGKINVIDKSHLSFLYFPKSIAISIKNSALQVFSDKTAPLMTALLTGDTSLLYEDSVLYAEMAEAGILHVVAVSGMNVAFLVGFIQLVIRRKKIASFLGIPMVLLFIIFAGSSPSVIRAACMQIMLLVAPLLRRENDGITSLTLVLAVMLLINPNACASVSLQLSFSATLGIIIITPKIYKSLSRKVKSVFGKAKSADGFIWKATEKAAFGICAAFAATVGAMVFSTPISAFYFGYGSIVGIFENILIFWAISVCFILGYISCFLGMLYLPAGSLVGALTSLIVRYIILVVQAASSIPYAAIYTKGNMFTYWLILLYLLFILCYVFKRKEGFRPVIPVCLALTSLCFIILFTEISSKQEAGSFTAVDVGQGQSFVITSGEVTAVIDCGGKGKDGNAGDTVAAFLLGSGRQTVDILALTHFDDDHVNGVVRLMSRVNVKRLIIPEGYNIAAKNEIISIAEKCDTQVYIIQEDTAISANDLNINVYPVLSQGEYGLMYLGTLGDFDALITGDADIVEEEQFLESHSLTDAELFVAGHHGSKHSSGSELLKTIKAEYAVVSSGYNSYGHPSEETLERFENSGMRILRTDFLGNICIRLNGKEAQLG